jgi:hypothetical protein
MSARNSFQAIRSQLFPRLQRPREGTAGVFVADQLEVGLVCIDGGTAIDVTHEDLAAWGVTFQKAYDVAIANLRKRSTKARWQEVDTVPGMSIYLPGDGDAASRSLLVAELVNVPPEGLLFAVPSRDQFLVVRLADADALEAIRVLVNVAHVAAASHRDPLTDQLFWYDGEQIVHVPVVPREDDLDVVPPPGLLAAVERLVGASLLPAVAEA